MDIGENPDLIKKVESNTPMKEWLVNYVGNKHESEGDEVTVEMIIDIMADEFPEFLMVLAEENWIRGYHQAMTDVEMGEELLKNEAMAKTLENQQNE